MRHGKRRKLMRRLIRARINESRFLGRPLHRSHSPAIICPIACEDLSSQRERKQRQQARENPFFISLHYFTRAAIVICPLEPRGGKSANAAQASRPRLPDSAAPSSGALPFCK